MPLREVSVMDQRREFVRLAMQEGANRRELCRRFGIHPDTGYKWLDRWRTEKEVVDRSRRPHSSPQRTDREIEERVLAVRDAHPAWGARKIVRCLERESQSLPAFSTVHQILRRTGRIKPPVGGAPSPVNALRCLRQIYCGRWTSRAGCGWVTTRNAIL
jgi:transposase-like protein